MLGYQIKYGPQLGAHPLFPVGVDEEAVSFRRSLVIQGFFIWEGLILV